MSVLVMTAAMVAATCGGGSPVAPSALEGGPWNLVSLQEEGSALTTVDRPGRYTLKFDDEFARTTARGNITVGSDCNSCFGGYSLNDSSLALGPIACTRVDCGGASLDRTYVRGLEQARTVSVDGSEMTIRGRGVTLKFLRLAR